jgi:uncharacterized protein YegP (UPF0339 family)
MGFMTKEELSAHTKMGHIAEKVPEPIPPVDEVTKFEPLPPTEAITKPMPVAGEGVFEVIYDVAGTFRFHLKAANGQIIAVSQSYGTKESALKGIASIKKNAPIAKTADLTPGGTIPESEHKPGIIQDAVFEIQFNAPDRFRFHLKAANGQIIAVSQSYGTKESALKGIASIKKNAPIAKTADLTPGGTIPESEHKPGIIQDAVFEIQFNAPDRFRFHLKAANGQIIAVSQSYLSKQSAENGIASMKTNAPMAKIIDQTIAAI